MKFVIRADASLMIGSGHVSRCLTLAETLRDAGHDVTFVSRELKGNMNVRLHDAGLKVHGLKPPAADLRLDETSARMLGVRVEDDAAETLAFLAGREVDWVIADHYAVNTQWEAAVRGATRRLMIIDDLANRPHNCDVLVDQNLFFAGQSRYLGLVGENCQLLVGPDYALINKNFARLRARPPRDRSLLKRILLYFGGGNTAPALCLNLAVLSEPEFEHIAVDVIANPQMEGFADVKSMVLRRPRSVLHRPLPNLADMLASVDLAIGGSGGTTWERMCLGLPSIVVVMAENQRILATELHERGLTINLGDIAALTTDAIRSALRQSARPGVLQAASPRLRGVCDGQGPRRILERLATFS